MEVTLTSKMAALPAMLFFIGGSLWGQSFSDNFNRADGPVGNGWGTWNGTALSDGQVMNFGSDGAGGGIYRSFPVTFPVTFAFDFRSPGPSPSCDPGHPGGGWIIAFNAPGGGYAGAQYEFYQYAGAQSVNRLYRTTLGQVDDSLPSISPNFGPSFVHISGTVNADFSATITIGGQTYQFGPASSPIATPLGTNLVLSNSICGGGPYFFDNVVIAIGPRYNVCPLYDSAHAKKAGSTIPIKLQLCDNSGNNLSSSSIVVRAVSISQASTSISGVVEGSGNANPDSNFRFDSGLGTTGGYIFNFKTAGLATGTYNLNFTVTGDSFVYATPFQIK